MQKERTPTGIGEGPASGLGMASVWPGEAERIMYVANAEVATLQLSFLKPLAACPEIVGDILTEQDLRDRFGDSLREAEAADWIVDRLESFRPSLIVLCRYSSVHADVILAWAKRRGIPTIYQIDDNLLDVPKELGAAKRAMHSHPDRLATVRTLLSEASVVYCSTEPLRACLFGDVRSERVVVGDIIAGLPVLAGPKPAGSRAVIGYMGSSSHRIDFEIALPGVIAALDSFPDATFEMFGSIPVPDSLARFGDRIRTVEVVEDYGAFLARLATLGWTIGICPLQDLPFNYLKSNLKWIEYTATGSAVVATAGSIYDGCCEGGCGVLAADTGQWIRGLSRLIEDDSARLAQVGEAQARLNELYTPRRQLQQLAFLFGKARALATATGAQGMAETGERSGEHNELHMHLDSINENWMNGWAWIPAERHKAEPDREAIELRCGRTRVGRRFRRHKRQDVDSYVGDATGDKGFSVPAACLTILWSLMRRDDGVQPRIGLETEQWSLYDINREVHDPVHFRTLRSVDGQSGFKILDLWWSNPYLLKLRIDTSGSSRAFQLRLFQPVVRPDGRIELAATDAAVAPSGITAVISLGTASPCMPLLLAGSDEADDLVFTDLIPFPSLLRGGLHESETAALGPDGGTLADCRLLNDAYVFAALDLGPQAGGFAVSRIGVDISDASGAEMIFDPALVSWLGRGLGLGLAPESVADRRSRDLGDDTFIGHVTERLEPRGHDQARPGRFKLTLPSQALPTIAALTSRHLAVVGDQRPSSYVVVDEATARRRWLIEYPGSGPELPGGLLEAPFLSAVDDQAAGDSLPEHGLPPLGIVFRDLSPKLPSHRLFPVPKDRASVLPMTGGSVTSITFLPLPIRNLATFTESLASQEVAEGHDVVVVAAGHNATDLERLHQTLDRSMPGRAQIIPIAAGLARSAALNRASEAAKGETLVLLDASIILHDRRTLATLAGLCASKSAGTVGCTVFEVDRGSHQSLRFRSSGHLPARLDFAAAPRLAVAEIDVVDVLPMAIYPVVANSALCFAVSSAAWAAVGGFDERRFPGAYAEIDFAVRLVAEGRVNLCSTHLSVSCDAGLRARHAHDISALTQLGIWRMAEAMRTSIVVRTL